MNPLLTRLQRMTCKTVVLEYLEPFKQLEMKREIRGAMQPDSAGEYVKADQVSALLDELEARIPEVRIERLEKALGLVSEGRCPDCGRLTRDWKAPEGSFAPEAWATLKEHGIDPRNGHAYICRRNPGR